MRTVAEIQAEIENVQAQIAALEADIANTPDESNDPEWEIARRNYINTGDMSGISNWYSRRDQNKQREIDNAFREREIALQEREHANGGSVEPGSDKAKELVKNYDLAVNAVKVAKEQFGQDGSPAAKAALYTAEQELFKAEYELKAAGLGSHINPVEGEGKAVAAGSPKQWTINDIDAFDRDVMVTARNGAKGKDKFYWADKDYDAARQQAWEMSGSPDAEIRARGMKLLSEIDGMRKYRESDRKSAEGAAANKVNAALNQLPKYNSIYNKIPDGKSEYSETVGGVKFTFKKEWNSAANRYDIGVYSNGKKVSTLSEKDGK